MPIEQLDVFGGSVPLASAPRVRATDPDTSRAAAEAVNLNARCAEVLSIAQLIESCYYPEGWTDGQLAEHCDEDRNIVARRRKDLTDGRYAGHVEPVMGWDDQQERVIGRRGREELVWRLTEKGRNTITNQEVPST